MSNMKKAVVLLSGGLDSTTALAIASKQDGYKCYAMSFNYSQRHSIELEYARKQAKLWECEEHVIQNISMEYVGRHNADASLVNLDVKVPEMREIDEMTDGIPSTYVPARNTIFLAHATSYAEVVGAEAIYGGMNALDYSGYPDCRPEFIEAYQNMISYATKAGVEGNPTKIVTPLILSTKVEIIEMGLKLGVDYDQTSSCYNPILIPDAISAIDHEISKPCGKCDSCILRDKGFAEVEGKRLASK